jgi:hypothetical protein
VSGLSRFKEYLNLNESLCTFSNVEIWTMNQGFESNRFELKVSNILKFALKMKTREYGNSKEQI